MSGDVPRFYSVTDTNFDGPLIHQTIKKFNYQKDLLRQIRQGMGDFFVRQRIFIGLRRPFPGVST